MIASNWYEKMTNEHKLMQPKFIEQAIEDAKNGKSKLSDAALDIQGFTSHNNKRIMNNLGALSTRYLEVGIHKSAMFVATLYKNNIKGVACDNWCQFEEGGFAKEMAIKNTFKYLDADQYQIYEMDCWDFPIEQFKNEFDMYCYDGNHSYEFQRDGLTKFISCMKDEFIFICDDFSWPDPKRGTEEAIKELNLKVLFHSFLWDGKPNGEFHNGLGIFLLKKINMGLLNDIANKYQTDKGDSFFEAHGYADVYEKIFPARDAKISMLEIGIKDVHFPGASMKMWDEYFTNPDFKFLGLDVSECWQFETQRMKTAFADQNDKEDLLNAVGDSMFDIIVEDGCHLHYAQRVSFETLFPKVKEGGLYIIEDLHINNGHKTIKYITDLFIPFDLYCNDKLIVIKKP